MPATRVGVIGAAGKMGRLTCETVEDEGDLDLVARITRDGSLDELAQAHVQVAVDLTNPDVVMDHVKWCVDHDVSVVVGTSGFDDARLATVRSWLADRAGRSGQDAAVLVVPNFSIGAVLMMRFAQKAAAFFESAEIIELHHPAKADAPSGTSIRTAQLIAHARANGEPMPDATTSDAIGSRGGRIKGVPIHSVRARGFVAHQEVLFGNPGETLTIRHDMPDRVAAMPGVLASIRAVTGLTGLHVGLDVVLGLAEDG